MAGLIELRQSLDSLMAEARRYASASRAGNTRKAYRTDWADFTNWCDRHGLAASPAQPETVALYLTDLARQRRPATLARRLAAISQFHQAFYPELPSPAASTEVRLVLAGIRRQQGTAPRRKRPLLGPTVAEAAAALFSDHSLLATRNRALLLTAYAGALRRSEAVALDWEDVEIHEAGVTLRVRRSKTDQAGQGSAVGLALGSQPATCPAAALRQWRERCGMPAQGPVFRVIGRAGKVMEERLSDKAVARLVKQTTEALGLEPRDFSAHSLRAGLATTAAANGASERKIMDQTRHRSLKTARIYIREGDLFRDNASARAGL